jgi:hypothetical protein
VRISFFALALFVLAMKSFAQFAVSTDASHLFGSTSYRYNALAVTPSAPNEPFPIASELEFPLDAWLIGVSASWQPSGTRFDRWNIRASAALNMSDPSQSMTDNDWRRGRKIQYTESDASLKMLLTSAEVGFRLLEGRHANLSLLACTVYQRISQDMSGFEGLYYDELLQSQRPISGTGPVLEYRVSYVSPQAGAAASVALPFRLTGDVQSTAGLVFAWDKTDHLLRGKRAEGDATGFGTCAMLELWRPTFRIGKCVVKTGVSGDLRYFHANGEVTQRWYRDETTPDGTTPAGTTLTGLPHGFKSLQYSVGVHVGIRL